MRHVWAMEGREKGVENKRDFGGRWGWRERESESSYINILKMKNGF